MSMSGRKNEFKRVKFGAEPGDISIQGKIKLRENTEGKGGNKSYQKFLADKGKTVQRRRDKTTIERELKDLDHE